MLALVTASMPLNQKAFTIVWKASSVMSPGGGRGNVRARTASTRDEREKSSRTPFQNETRGHSGSGIVPFVTTLLKRK